MSLPKRTAFSQMRAPLFLLERVSLPVMGRLLSLRSNLITRKARLIFEQAATSPAWLDQNMISVYQKQYPNLPPYGYDSVSLEKRGEERAKRILSIVPPKKIKTFLELGCWDGMVSCGLQRHGKTTIAIDIRSDGFDERAKREGVLLMKMDANHLEFKDETFDMAFSFDAFEHFADPESALQEIIRVVRIGGYIYLEFGPIFMSPFGAHLYRQIKIPYSDILFSKDSLQKFANSERLGILDPPQCNRYTLENFRKLWTHYSDRLKRARYLEVPILQKSCIKLIETHPSCFKSKTQNFDNLVISSIQVLFKKIR